MKNKLITILYIVALTCFALTFSISIPICCRFIYFMQIDSLNLVEVTGYSKDIIVKAYNETLNFLTIPWVEFSTGALKYSSSGASHFKDVKNLFIFNFAILISSVVSVAVLTILNKKGRISLINFGNKTPYFYSAIINIALPLLIGGIALINFEAVFDVFHYIFFPGKSDWLFNPKTDEIIKILPMEFFASCAVIIGVALIIISIIYIIIDRKKK